ncbi:MAG: hypothetical protein P0119_21770 [Nitrospira sp.]|nr:hypothetical protein [Nitrospira sp.]
MNTRISAMICLLCVFSYSDLTRAQDPYSQRVADPYAISPNPPNMSAGTPELYLSFMAGVGMPLSEDATFTDGSQPTVMPNINYAMKQSIGGNAGIWFPTRNKLAGLDLGGEIEGFIWFPDVNCCVENFNGVYLPDGMFQGTTTEMQGVYVGANFLIRKPMAVSEAYPNGRWFPYVGVGVGAHQIAYRPGGFRGAGFQNAITDQRDTTVGFLAKGGLKFHLFKYLAAFAEAKYTQAFHDQLGTDRYGVSEPGAQNLTINTYSSTIQTIFVHAGLSLHFDVKP